MTLNAGRCAAAPVSVGICDGSGLQFIDTKDLSYWTFVNPDDPEGRRTFVLVRGHVHPGKAAGQYAPGVTAEADDELRKIIGES